MPIKRYNLNVIWQPGSSSSPTTNFVQAEGGKWCKAEHVERLEHCLEGFVSPGVLARAWHWLAGRKIPKV